MGFFKKRGKPRQYLVRLGRTQFNNEHYMLDFWNGYTWYPASFVVYGSPVLAREFAALDAELHGYGDNYEITELI